MDSNGYKVELISNSNNDKKSNIGIIILIVLIFIIGIAGILKLTGVLDKKEDVVDNTTTTTQVITTKESDKTTTTSTTTTTAKKISKKWYIYDTGYGLYATSDNLNYNKYTLVDEITLDNKIDIISSLESKTIYYVNNNKVYSYSKNNKNVELNLYKTIYIKQIDSNIYVYKDGEKLIKLIDNSEYQEGFTYNLSLSNKKGAVSLSEDFLTSNLAVLDVYESKNSDIDHEKSKSYIYDIKNNKIKKELGSPAYCGSGLKGNGNVYVYEEYACDGTDFAKYMINKDVSKVIELNAIADHYIYISKNNIIVYKDGEIVTYNNSLDIIGTSKQYKDVFMFVEQYGLVETNDNKLAIINIDKKEIIKEFCDWTDKMYVHTLLSGRYEDNGKKGLYFVIQDDSVTADDVINNSDYTKDEINDMNLGYELYYIPETGETGKIYTFIGGYAKPVLYLYPKEDNPKVTVNFAKENLLTTTYPKFIGEWSVTANKNGDLYDASGKYYYGLYWEENGSTKVDFSTGFYVTKDNAIDFLEEKLSIIGLNDREANEFIMYWLPILEKNQKSLVYFELTEERNKYNELIISPKPDSLLRVAIHVKKVDEKVNIKEEKLTTFNRVGFTAVEWGGVIH